MKLSFVLPGMHRVHRGAEVAFEAVAEEIARLGMDDVTVLGSGPPILERSYSYRSWNLIPRQRFEAFPKFPPFRSEYVYEEASWVVRGLREVNAQRPDVTISCSYPFVNWRLTRGLPRSRRPAHVFVTQNGDWPSFSNDSEARLFRCDGLVCTNPVYFDRNKARWNSALIPNGVDPARFFPGPPARPQLDLRDDQPVVLIVCALVESKRVLEALRVLSRLPDVMVLVAGDGPLRDEVDNLAAELMPGRVRRVQVSADRMPDLYRSADVLVHPALFESFGNVYVEAMACGLPVVAHDSDVTRWIFGEHPGLIDVEDDGALLDAVRRAIADGREDAARRTAGAVERFSWAAIAGQYRSFLSTVVDATSRS